ncbi:hypothetical protein ACWJJH_22455 [Endozoicomonadaceae bacterium StTr2]
MALGTRHIARLFFGCLIFLGASHLSAAQIDIVAYMGHHHVFLVISDDEGHRAVGIRSSAENGYLWGDPSNMRGNNSPVIVFYEALKDAAPKWPVPFRAGDTCRVYIGIAAYQYYCNDVAALTVEKVENDYPQDIQEQVKAAIKDSVPKKDERFRIIFAELIKKECSGLNVEPKSVRMNGEHNLAHAMAVAETGKTSLDLFLSATCGVPFTARDGVLEAVKILEAEGKACGQFELGYRVRQKHLEVEGSSSDDFRAVESGNRRISEKGTSFHKVLNASPFICDFNRYPETAAEKGWKHKDSKGEHGFKRWTYNNISKWPGVGSTPGFGMVEIGATTMAVCTRASQEYCLQRGISSAIYDEAQQVAHTMVCEYPVQSMATIIGREFRVRQEGSSYPVSPNPGQAYPVVVVGEFSWALPELSDLLKSKLDAHDQQRLVVISGDNFIQRLPEAGKLLLDGTVREFE